jgi:hypothetical protein
MIFFYPSITLLLTSSCQAFHAFEGFSPTISNRLIQPEPDWLLAHHYATPYNAPTLLQWNPATFMRRRLYLRATAPIDKAPFSATNAE